MKFTQQLLTAVGVLGPAPFQHFEPSNRAVPVNELQGQLSSDASISFPGSPDFAESISRWSNSDNPGVDAVVHAQNTDDIAKTLKFAIDHDIPFLASNSKHGIADKMNGFKGGIQIDLSGIKTMELSADKTSVTVGPGVNGQELQNYLFPRGRMGPSGACGCVGVIGAGVGGGVGKLLGAMGLITDSILEATIILANGTVVTASEKSNPDLFWGVRGAGHNFGMITSVKYRTHPYLPADGHWYTARLVVPNEKLEETVAHYNRIGSSHQRLTLNINMMIDKRISDTEPALQFIINYAGTEKEATSIIKPILDLSVITVINASTPFNLVVPASRTGMGDPLCIDGLARFQQYSVNVNSTEPTAVRKISNLMRDAIKENPKFDGWLALEAYDPEVMMLVPAESTAYPWRSDKFTTYFASSHTDPELDDLAKKVGEKTREIFLESTNQTQAHTYVNYARGYEPPQQWYGWEPWRLERLQALKRIYDPEQRFSWYQPIPI